MKFIFYLILIMPFFATVSYGQSEGENEARKEALSFDDELIQGSSQKPELFYLLQKKRFNYKRLIRLRSNFLPEMRKATESVNFKK